MALLDAALGVLRDLGATVLDPVELPGAAGISDPEWVSLRHDFKREINGYLRAVPRHAPRSLAELIDFNIHNGPSVLAHFGQEILVQAEATSGDPADPAALAARAEAGSRAREGAGRSADQPPARRYRHADREPGGPVSAGHRADHGADHRADYGADRGADHPGRPRGAAEITCAHGLLAWRKHS